MSNRPVPVNLIPVNTRDNKEWHTEMITKYNKMKKNYDPDIDNADIAEEKIYDNVNFDEDDKVINFITKSREIVAKLKSDNKSINNTIEEYEKTKEQIDKFNKLIDEGNNLYREIMIKSHNIPFNLNFPDKQLITTEDKLNIATFSNNIDDKILELNNKIKDNTKKLTDFKNLILRCMEDEKVEYNICNVCITNKINTCINPCGHTFCSYCVERMGKKCGMCRGDIQNKIKMYIDNDTNDNKEGADGDIIGMDIGIGNINPGAVPGGLNNFIPGLEGIYGAIFN